MNWLFYVSAGAAGALSTALSGTNGTLSKQLGQPVTAGLIVEVATLPVLVAAGLLFGGMGWPPAAKFAALPWGGWLGGLGGAALLMTQLLVAQKIGASPYLAITVTAGVAVSIAMDHWGWLGFERNPAHLGRLIGGALMVMGVLLVARN